MHQVAATLLRTACTRPLHPHRHPIAFASLSRCLTTTATDGKFKPFLWVDYLKKLNVALPLSTQSSYLDRKQFLLNEMDGTGQLAREPSPILLLRGVYHTVTLDHVREVLEGTGFTGIKHINSNKASYLKVEFEQASTAAAARDFILLAQTNPFSSSLPSDKPSALLKPVIAYFGLPRSTERTATHLSPLPSRMLHIRNHGGAYPELDVIVRQLLPAGNYKLAYPRMGHGATPHYCYLACDNPDDATAVMRVLNGKKIRNLADEERMLIVDYAVRPPSFADKKKKRVPNPRWWNSRSASKKAQA